MILGKRRIKKPSEKKLSQKVEFSNLVPVSSIDQVLSSESLLSSVQAPLAFTYENPTNSTTIPMTK